MAKSKYDQCVDAINEEHNKNFEQDGRIAYLEQVVQKQETRIKDLEGMVEGLMRLTGRH